MTRPWTLLLLSVAVAAKKQDVYASASTLELKKALYVRGLACDDCDRKALEAKAVRVTSCRLTWSWRVYTKRV